MGDAPGAAQALRRELAINPNHFDAHLLLGLLLRQDSRNDEAREHVEKALSLRPGDPGARHLPWCTSPPASCSSRRAGRSSRS